MYSGVMALFRIIYMILLDYKYLFIEVYIFLMNTLVDYFNYLYIGWYTIIV